MKTVIDAVNEFKGVINDSTLVIIHDGRGCYESSLPEIVSDFYKLTCTREEFNQYVHDCSSNFCESSFKHLKIWQESLKHNTNDFTQCNPVYTQVMADNGELPSVGMECMIANGDQDPEKCVLLYSSGAYFIVSHGSWEQHYHARNISFSPLTPPIELIDGEAYQFEYMNKTRVGYYCTDNDQLMFRGGWGRGSICTNIQLLEVKS